MIGLKLAKAEIEHLLWALRGHNGDYYGSQAQFEKRHAELYRRLKEALSTT